MPPITHAILDLDGTLLDSTALWEGVGETLLARYSIPPPPGHRAFLYAHTVPETAVYYRGLGLPLPPEEIVRAIYAIPAAAYRDSLPLKPGARSLLTGLHARGIPLALATATQGELAEAALTRLGVRGFFTALLTTDGVGAGKEAPTLFLAAAAALNTTPASCLVVEDSLYALSTAKAAGFWCAGVADPASAADEPALRALAHLFLPDYTPASLAPLWALLGG